MTLCDVVQTRSEENGLEKFPTIKEAFDRAEQDQSIWKISFTMFSGERVRLIRQEDRVLGVVWIYESINDSIKEL